MYINEFSSRHAEDMFTLANHKVKDGKMLPELYITNSPCSKCAKTLMKFYNERGGSRPTLYIGKIYRPGGETENSLRAMWKDGFDFEVWEKANKVFYSTGDTSTRKFLNKIKR